MRQGTRGLSGIATGIVSVACAGALVAGTASGVSAARVGFAGADTAWVAMNPADDLDGLFAELKAARDPAHAEAIEDRIWQIWSKSGNAGVDSLFEIGMIAILHGDYSSALAFFEQVTERAPNFAEGWNKRASVEYQLGDLDAALRDVERTLAIERRHFGAMSGRALIYIAVGDDKDALQMFERALAINPASIGLRRQVQRLRDKLGFRAV
jgi:tetratricopeptide (TPR) repeat protein